MKTRTETSTRIRMRYAEGVKYRATQFLRGQIGCTAQLGGDQNRPLLVGSAGGVLRIPVKGGWGRVEKSKEEGSRSEEKRVEWRRVE